MKYYFFLLLFTFSLIGSAQVDDSKTLVSKARYLGKSAPLKDVANFTADSKYPKNLKKDNPKKYLDNFFNRTKSEFDLTNAFPKGADKTWQSEHPRMMGPEIEPSVNVEGIHQNPGASQLPDVTGAIGKDHFLQMVNATVFRVYNKDGSPASAASNMTSFWGQFGRNSGGDPIVVYDALEERWLMAEFPSALQPFLLVAVSTSSDPMGTWNAYEFNTPNFPDYPKFAVWNNEYVVTTNEGGNLPVYCIEKAPMIAGQSDPNIVRVTIPRINGGPGFQVTTPVNVSGKIAPGDNQPLIVRMIDDAWGEPQDGLELWSVDIDWNNPNAASIARTNELITEAFDSYPCNEIGGGFACIPTPNSNQSIDGQVEIINHQVHYRQLPSYEAITLSFIADANGNNLSGMRWFELRRSPGADWVVHQEGLYAPDDDHRFIGGIAIDDAGNIGMAYNVSNTDRFPSLAMTARRASDPLGMMTFDEYVIQEGSSTKNSDRFGDYSQMTVDPEDGRTFWFTGQYMDNGGQWGTRIVAFDLGRDSFDMAVNTVIEPLASSDLTANEEVTVAFQNNGLETVESFEIALVVDGNPIQSLTINETLESEEIYEHQFTMPVDLSAVGDHTILATVDFDGDQNASNDELEVVLTKYAKADAGIISVSDPGQNCGEALEIDVVVQNFSDVVLENVIINIEQGGMLSQTFMWSGNLGLNETESIAFTLSDLSQGINNLDIYTSMPNGMVDEVPSNDASSRTFEALLNGVDITLNLQLDFYPNETSWDITDEQGNVLFEGGGYTQRELIVETFCLNPDECYIFNIYDTAQDGLTGLFGNLEGSYEIVDADGVVLASINQINFGAQETTGFCGMFMCNLNANIDLTPESSAGAGDGVIIITAQNANPPIQYSIDGGNNFSVGNMFINLPSNTYDIMIIDGNDCEYMTTVEILSCTLMISAGSSNASTSNSLDGEIEVTATGGTPPLQYSADNGNSFQSSNVFQGLPAGDYTVLVMDAEGCVQELIVTIDATSSNQNTLHGTSIKIYPNPNNGLFHISVKSTELLESYIDYEILDAAGRLIKNGKLSKFSEEYIGQVSILTNPSGLYFIRFESPELSQMVRLIKE